MGKPFEKPNKNDWLKDIGKYLTEEMTLDHLRVKKDTLIIDPIYGKEDKVDSLELRPQCDRTKASMWVDEFTDATPAEILKNLQWGIESLIWINPPFSDHQRLLKDLQLSFLQLVIVHQDPVEREKWKKILVSFPGTIFYEKVQSLDGGNQVMEQLKGMVVDSQTSLIRYRPSTDFYESISELRAVKTILKKLSFNYHLIGSVSREKLNNIGDFDLIEITYKVMSCYLGSCDFISFSGDEDEEFRLGANIVHILKYESGFDRVLDPVAGSYFIENYTRQLVEQF